MRQAGQRSKRALLMESLESRSYLSGDGLAPLVSVRLEVTDLDGQPIHAPLTAGFGPSAEYLEWHREYRFLA